MAGEYKALGKADAEEFANLIRTLVLYEARARKFPVNVAIEQDKIDSDYCPYTIITIGVANAVP